MARLSVAETAGDTHGEAGEVQLRDQPGGSGSTCRSILAALPTWFGIEEAVESYAVAADRLPTVIASLDGEDVGLLTVLTFGSYAAEVLVMAVLPEHHRRGVGRRMLEHAESALADAGVEFLQVKTLSSRRPDAGYEKTRAFYLACGFRPLEEFPDLWGRENPALQMIKALGPANASTQPSRCTLLGPEEGR